MAHLAEPVLRRGWREAALLTPAELTAAHKGAVEALVVDGESKRARSHAMHAASALRHRAYQGVAGEPGAQRGGGVAESRMVILADSVEYAQSRGPGWYRRTQLTATRSSFDFVLDHGAGGKLTAAGADLGDTPIHQPDGGERAAKVVGNACVYNVLSALVRLEAKRSVARAAAAGHARPAWTNRGINASAGDLLGEAHTAALAVCARLGPPLERMTRT